MSGRSPFHLLLVGVLTLLPGCVIVEDGADHRPNEIVFGIGQRVDPATGELEVTAGYDFVGLANRGGSSSMTFRDGDGDGTCYFERYDRRLGALRVDGVARWAGGKLPASGLEVRAGTAERARYAGEGWAADDVLTFDVSGFAMPRLEPVTLRAPRLELGDVAFAPAVDDAGALTIDASREVGVTWTPLEPALPASVMVTLEIEEEGAGAGVRCFDDAAAGGAIIPSEWVARVLASASPGKPVHGRIAVSSHRQVTYYAEGGWIAYIVAMTEHRTQPFAVER